MESTRITYIYTLIDPRCGTVRYVGKSDRPFIRHRQHLSDKAKYTKAQWIQALLRKDLEPILEIVEVCKHSEWVEREAYWMTKFKDLYNSAKAGQGGCNVVWTDERKAAQVKIFQKGLERKFGGNPINDKEIRKKIISKGKITIKRAHKANKKPVKQLDRITGDVIKIWDSAADAKIGLGVKDDTCISDVCNNRKGRKTAYGFKWEFAH